MAENYRHQGYNQNRDTENRGSAFDPTQIKFGESLNAELFNGVAHEAAKAIAKAEDKLNKPTQLRRFYDEMVLWETRVSQQPDKFNEYLPFIRMMNAKAAYAEGRKLVNPDFVRLMNHTLGQVKDPETLTHCKLFWEAFMGFYKQVRPKD
jgi:CRISPR-associated protein Csm2